MLRCRRRRRSIEAMSPINIVNLDMEIIDRHTTVTFPTLEKKSVNDLCMFFRTLAVSTVALESDRVLVSPNAGRCLTGRRFCAFGPWRTTPTGVIYALGFKSWWTGLRGGRSMSSLDSEYGCTVLCLSSGGGASPPFILPSLLTLSR